MTALASLCVLWRFGTPLRFAPPVCSAKELAVLQAWRGVPRGGGYPPGMGYARILWTGTYELPKK
jgi:hypothetical protein